MNNLIENNFYDYLEKFLDEIKKSFDNYKSIIEEKYNDIRNPEIIKIIEGNLISYKEDFLGNREKLDELFDKNEIYLFEDISISELWKKSDLDNKNAIIQYIKVFILIFETNNNNNIDGGEENIDNGFGELLKEQLLNKEDNLKEFYQNINKNEDNSIVKMAKDIASKLNDKNEGGDLNIMNLLNGSGGGLNNLIGEITSKIDNEIKTGKVNQSDLLKDAQNIMGQNGNLFENLFNGLDMSKMNNMGNMSDMGNMSPEEIMVNGGVDDNSNVKKKDSKKKNKKKNKK
tara:strand:- start:70 stop:930 length:861 start_codon:yes stop_codon:yes gene_type:complete